LFSCFSPALLGLFPPPPFPIPFLLSPCVHGKLLILYSLSLSLCLSVSLSLFSLLSLSPSPSPSPPPSPSPSILYYTIIWLVPQGEGMPQHGPAETSSSPIPDYTPIEHIPLLFIFL
jgi:hypothetical protein